MSKLLMCAIYLYLFTTIRISMEKMFGNNLSIRTPDHIKTVTISGSLSCDICLYDENPNKTNEVYSAITCKLATWTINKIYNETIKTYKSPLFYQMNLNKNDIEYNKMREGTFQSFINSLKTIKTSIKEFINIIEDFQSPNSYYNDNSIQKIFVSLEIKIGFWLSPDFEHQKSENFLFRMIVEEVIALQRFLSMNCSDPPISDKNSKLFNCWIDNDNLKTNYDMSGNEIIDIIKKIRPKTSISSDCTVFDHILLESIVKKESNDLIFKDIANSTFKMSNSLSYTMSILLEISKSSYNVELLFWYQDSVIRTIMTLICKKISRVLSSKSTQRTSNIIKMINELNNVKSKPIYFERGFAILNNAIKQYSEVKLKDDSQNVGIQLLKSEILDDIELYILELTRTGLIVVETTNNTEDDINSLKIILKELIEKKDFLKCFNRYFKWLHNEMMKPYLNGKHMFVHVETCYTKEELCEFFSNIYTLCYQAVIFTNEIIDNTENKSELSSKALELINYIIIYFINIIDSNKQIDYELRNISYSVIFLLRNQVKNNESFTLLKRTLNVVMAELNSVGIRYCNESKPNFLFFYDINFTNLSIFPTYIVKMFLETYFSNDVFNPDLESDQYGHLNLKYLYTNYIEKSQVITNYSKQILIYWNGKKSTLPSIIENMMYFCTHPKFLFAFYDMYFKFYIAVIFYEIKYTLEENKRLFKKENWEKRLDVLKDLRNILNDEEMYNFPSELFRIKRQILLLFSKRELILNPNCSDIERDPPQNSQLEKEYIYSNLLQLAEIIDSEFEKLNFVFNMPCKFKEIVQTKSPTDTKVAIIKDEFLGNLKKVKGLFERFSNFSINEKK